MEHPGKDIEDDSLREFNRFLTHVALIVIRKWRLEGMETVRFLFVVAAIEKNFQLSINVEIQKKVV